MKIKNWFLSEDQKKLRMDTDEGTLRLYAVSGNIIRCVFMMEGECGHICDESSSESRPGMDEASYVSPLGISVDPEGFFEVHEEEVYGEEIRSKGICGEEIRGEEIHREEIHGEKIHREKIRGEKIHREEILGEEIHREEIHGEKIHLENAPVSGEKFLLVSVSGEKTGGALKLRINCETGRFTWLRAVTGDILLEEGDKELTKTPVEVWSTGGEEPVVRRVKTVDGERSFIENLKATVDHMACRAKLSFRFQPDEAIHGLGQGEEGIYNYRGHVQYLYQHNMRIPAPWILSDRGYAILADCGSLMTFNDDERGSYLFLDTVECLDYYFIAGERVSDLIRAYRKLTGKAAMLPKWAFGYIQSRERYRTQEEVLDVAREYRRRGVGLDCVVQDWKTWSADNWGEKIVDQERFPDLKEMNRQLKEMHVHSMVSVWPNMNYDTADCCQMREGGFLLSDLSTYDAFDSKARALYWKQAKRELFDGGFDSWWCDSTEPFSGPDWGGETKKEPWERYLLVGSEHKKFLGAERANLYALAHAQGIYENQRSDVPGKRVVNLTRSGYTGIQKYGTILWSGDTSASWTTMRTQVTESLNMALSGIPYWTLDIGGFFTVWKNWQARGCECGNDPTPKWFWHGDFEEGVNDPGYRELYVRWIQWGMFLPIFRSHGTDTPREIWHFGDKGDAFYDAIADAIELRYRLMPYIYSLAGSAWHNDTIMQRPLLAAFPEDKKAAASDAAFMLGDAFLVFPVTEPMDYAPGGKKLTKDHVWECYLPAGAYWYDFYTGKLYEGGQSIPAKAPLSHSPVFVRAGSIVPMEEKLLYAQEVPDTPLQIHIYPGQDADFIYYEDETDGYGYEQGRYNRIRMHWDDTARVFTIGESRWKPDNGLAGRDCIVICGDVKTSFRYAGEEMRVALQG